MQQKIVDFTNLLRKSGIRVSVAESIDAFTALDELSLADRGIFKDALRTTMVKRSEDIATFDQMFDLYWSAFYDGLRNSFDQAAGDMEGEFDLDQMMQALQEGMQNMGGDQELDLSELAKALLTQDLDKLEQLIRDAAENAGVERIENMLQLGFFTRRTMEQMDAEGAGDQLRSLAQQLREAGMGDAEADALLELIDKFLEALRKSVRNYTERQLQQQNFDYMEKFRRESLLEKSFYNLTEDEIKKMREVVVRLAQRIKNVLSIRKRRLKKGKLDLHTMLRRNMAHGGVPFDLIFKQRRKDRPKLVILCDVSSSVANVSRFMLQFVYSLQECFTKIRAFVFVSELGEVTPVFKDKDINDAIEKALDGGDVINVYTRSNFGFAFHHFWQNFLSSIDNKTTVLILGDARNNYNDPRAWCLREIQNKAKDVVWLNPESPSAWGFGDSVMDKYLPYTDVAEECRNLKQLSRVVDRLVL
ncbi:MAG: VWA domain-containing protein [Deltaproteobacteria bacterium]|nr:VWA domain-containing protein [Deltaproteobacteria bacterium]MBW2393471.1 VWA domain-containing protein [Deltaproteobacteria bacterium]